MSPIRSAVLLVYAFILASCAEDKPVVAIDHWWNTDFAKNACEMRKNLGRPCVTDPGADVSDFERQLVTSFASDRSCKGIEVVTGFPTAKQYWLLMLDFNPGESAQSWTISRTPRTQLRTGEGTPDRIATTVCNALTGAGASIRE